jgi:thiol:disulfide interchange protein DsbD
MALTRHTIQKFGFAFLLLGLLVLSIARTAAQDFLDPEKAFVLQAQMVSSDKISLRFKIASGYYMYRERFSFELDTTHVKLGEPKMPTGRVKFDQTFNKEMELYFTDAVIELPISAWPSNIAPESFKLTVNGQGCAEAGLCYPPQDFVLQLTPQPSAAGYVLAAQASGSLFERIKQGQLSDLLFGSDDVGLAQLLSSTGLLEITLLFFALGLLLALTPCVLPMVPILSVLLVGEEKHVSRLRGFSLAMAYVAGMSVVYTALGVAAGLSGAGLAAWLQTPWVLGLFALLLGALALAMFDVYTFQMPASLQTKLMAKNSHILGGRVSAAALMGALSALIVGPCVAAPLAGALLYISQTGDVVLGGSALFAMAWGMGVPLLLMGLSAGKLMPRAGHWMDGVKKFFGVLLFATAWWMVTPLLPTWAQILGWAVLVLFAAVLLRTFEPLPQEARFGAILRKTFGLLLALLCLVWVVGVASGGRSLLQPLGHLAFMQGANSQGTAERDATSAAAQLAAPAQGSSLKQQLLGKQPAAAHPTFQRIRTVAELDAVLAKSTRPVMLDFYADWCVSCKEMEAFTFVDPRVVQRMGQLLLLQVDVTANNADDRALMKRYRLFGPPGIIFFSSGGSERRDIRVVGFQDANRFTATLDRALK